MPPDVEFYFQLWGAEPQGGLHRGENVGQQFVHRPLRTSPFGLSSCLELEVQGRLFSLSDLVGLETVTVSAYNSCALQTLGLGQCSILSSRGSVA